MELLWFYVAVVLAISDVLHTQVMWKLFNNHYILLGGLIKETVHTPFRTWLVHEIMEAIFHFIVITIVFLRIDIGLLAALLHLVIDISHTLLIDGEMNELQHRALHFVIEALFFLVIFTLMS